MTIFVDMDNVLANFTKAFVETCNNIFGTNIEFDDESHNAVWGVSGILFPGNTHQENLAITERVFNTPGFWLNMEKTEGATWATQKLQDNGHDVYIVTMPWPTSISCFIEKYYWIQKNIRISPSNIIYCKDKQLLRGDIIVDDRPEYLKNNSCDYTIAFDYKYNRDIDVDFRAKSWSKIVKFVEGIEGVRS